MEMISGRASRAEYKKKEKKKKRNKLYTQFEYILRDRSDLLWAVYHMTQTPASLLEQPREALFSGQHSSWMPHLTWLISSMVSFLFSSVSGQGGLEMGEGWWTRAGRRRDGGVSAWGAVEEEGRIKSRNQSDC